MTAPLDFHGIRLYPGLIDRPAQDAMVAALRRVAEAAPLFHPETRFGKKMSVKMTSAGAFGWVSDRRGYRYEPRHPSGVAWPPIPPEVRAIWQQVSGVDRAPECCLVNYYAESARMGLHQDIDESDFSMPVVSISLGDDALFRVGGLFRSDPTASTWLHSGDVCVLAGEARRAFHGIDRLKPGTSTLLPQGGRLNVTLRVVT
ncbi:alpha-ketoglutarate-dependent dioxygenase AlkB family protein [Vannielia litorea]|uniref:alpha-ketoglutarate-dependent dioxygenase AlkB family protein n=1 Tax=Vannielia litorea TaxID=1217970 RepID=UPI001C944B54|nr:alpha-ketoglutarate-dependent dioxygenase AlkB [Vannielia litorea]MBY6049499.1 alpha-ketoglutarate-dependent dioxygenase AlkB [Vannielia litorea]MBY6076913.1 alpha-ketoglutarate-dependent dioxygenase AlkB [Vannielia litorea]